MLQTKGGSKKGCACEWEPGFIVYWDINLKPKYRGTTPERAPSATLPTLGSAYRIEVLELCPYPA